MGKSPVVEDIDSIIVYTPLRGRLSPTDLSADGCLASSCNGPANSAKFLSKLLSLVVMLYL